MNRTYIIAFFLLASAAISLAADTTCVNNSPVDFKITNVITPNNDGFNDEFKVISQNLSDINVSIYDRWGVLVYSYSGVNGYWDGTLFGTSLTDGVFYYVANYSTTCKPNQTITMGGFVQLITGSGS